MSSGLPFEYSIRASRLAGLEGQARHVLEDERDRELEDFLARRLGQGTYDSPLRLGGSFLWVDATGDLRIHASQPSTDTDGTVVGSQT